MKRSPFGFRSVGALKETGRVRLRRYALLFLCLALAVSCLPPRRARAAEEKVVRVGWYESAFNTTDKNGRRSGYAYEYQMKIAAYTGWRYEYVSASWPELLSKLVKGEIDLMSDVSYLPERAENMLFSASPMGTEEYYLFAAPGSDAITPTDYSTLNGKKIGVNKDSIQKEFYLEWAERYGVEAELTEVECSEAESLKMLETGELDGYVTVDFFTEPDQAVPVAKVGSSDFFFAVNKERPDLLSELDAAMQQIQSEDRYFSQKLLDKNFIRSGASTFLAPADREWLAAHGPIRVGYQDNYLAFCAADPATGELTGALKDVLDYASGCIENADLQFEPVCCSTAEEAMAALQSGEVDCVFPANLSPYDAEKINLVTTPSLVRTNVFAIVSQSDRKFIDNRDHIIVAVNKGNPNYDSFLADNYPDWRTVYFQNTEECLQAVSRKTADCLLISNYRYNNISRLCDRYNLTAVNTGVDLDYCFALNRGESSLYNILVKVASLIPAADVNAALVRYVTEDSKVTVSDFLADHMVAVVAVLGAVILIILFLMVHIMRAHKKAASLISVTETDDLTGLYNRDYFFHYANQMYTRSPDRPMDALVMNIDQFHSVNALSGRFFGDQVLRVLGFEVRDIARENGGIAGRFGADRFDIYCRHLEDYRPVLSRLQGKLDEMSPNASIRLRMGVMPWQEKLEPVQLFDRARTACHMAREQYRNHLVIYDRQIGERETYEQRLLNDLSRALDSYEFEVWYQPQYDISQDPPRPVSAEALIRWRHPEFGLIPPGDFIPLLERSGKIRAVDQYVWSEAARQITRWREIYDVTIPVSVNLSRVDVFDLDLETTLDRILALNGLDHRVLHLEVTESAYTENADEVIRVVKNLRAKGYVVEMDDFGSGYSSLNMLSAMPVDVLKMDRGFIRNIDHDEKGLQLVALILSTAGSLKIPVVAEGVETEFQLKKLRELGCRMVQGFYFSKPVPASEFDARIIRNMQNARPAERGASGSEAERG